MESQKTIDTSLVKEKMYNMLFPENSKSTETVMLITKTKQFTWLENTQNRVLILTNKNIYIVSNTTIHSKFNIQDI